LQKQFQNDPQVQEVNLTTCVRQLLVIADQEQLQKLINGKKKNHRNEKQSTSNTAQTAKNHHHVEQNTNDYEVY
jgi:Zn-finger nucleic acid-binding protein